MRPPEAARDVGNGPPRVVTRGKVRVAMADTGRANHRGMRALSPDEWARAERVAERLHADLRRLVGGLPEHARGASAMARQLSVLRATCQRVVSAVNEPSPTPLMLTRLPGIQGLEQFLEGVAQAGVDAADVENARASVQLFDQLLRELGGSQSKLAERLSSVARPQQQRTGEAQEQSRQELFHAAARLVGRQCDVSLSVYAFRVAPDDAGDLEWAMGKGSIGHVMWPGAMPLLLAAGETLADTDEASDRSVTLLDMGRARGRTPEAVMREFTTQPLPAVTTRGSGRTVLQIVDPKGVDDGRPIDIVTAVRGRDPMFSPTTGKPTLDAVWTLVNAPTRHMVLDVYLHRDMERLYRPSLDVQMWNPGLNAPQADRWATRFPGGPRLQLLGAGVEGAETEAYARHVELTRALFARVGWDADEFVGFRCEVAFPIWRAGYCMDFEFTGEKPSGG